MEQLPQGTVLVVEDSPPLRRVLSDLLRSQGFTRVVEAPSGRAAKQLLAGERPDLVCVELTLPDISGYDVCEHIRATPGLETLPVLVLSERTQPVDRAQAEEAGASGYLIKPFTAEEFQQQVERVMAARPRKET